MQKTVFGYVFWFQQGNINYRKLSDVEDIETL